MKTKYKYKDGVEVKENDIVFYSEDDGSHKWHYADMLALIVIHEGVLKVKAHAITMDDAVTFEDYEEPITSCNSLFFHTQDHDKTTVAHLVKIGEYPKDKQKLTAKYANNNYSQK